MKLSLALIPLAAATAVSAAALDKKKSPLVTYEKGPYGLNNAKCSSKFVKVPIKSQNLRFKDVDQKYSTQDYVTGQILDNTIDPVAWAAAHLTNETFELSKTYSIYATYCEPIKGLRSNASLTVFTHGVSFDSTYWDFSYSPEYSVQKQLASWGFPSLRYDRLGCGRSTVPNNGFDETQARTELSIYASLLNIVRTSTQFGGKKWARVTGVGHSFGSVLNAATASATPDLLDATILTGFSAYQKAVATFTAGASFSIAKQTGRSKYSSLPSEWLVTGSAASLLFDFFRPPAAVNYDQAAFDASRQAEGPVTLGTLFSLATVGGPAPNFTKPVFVITGENDLPFCGGACSKITPSVADGVKQLFPAAQPYDVFVPNNTGHGITAHYTGPLVAQRIAQFLISNGL